LRWSSSPPLHIAFFPSKVAANLAGPWHGLVAGRGLVGDLAPTSRVAEFFGQWGPSVKAASIFGRSLTARSPGFFGGDHRLAILATSTYFVIGPALLAGIDMRRGRKAAIGTATGA